MQRLEVSGAVRPLQGSLGVKGLISRLLELSATVGTRVWHVRAAEDCQHEVLHENIETSFSFILTVQSFIYSTHIYHKIALYFILLKQHIKSVVLFKSPNNSPTCFGQFLTILREIFFFLYVSY